LHYKEVFMLKRYNLLACPVETTLMMVGDRWKILIVRNLLTGTKRFGELKKGLMEFRKRF